MVSRHARVHPARSSRVFLRFLAALLVFVQLAAVAATCVHPLPRGVSAACEQPPDRHAPADDAVCATEWVPSRQMAAGGPVVALPEPGPVVALRAPWPPAPRTEPAVPVADAAPWNTAVPRFLSLGRLLR